MTLSSWEPNEEFNNPTSHGGCTMANEMQESVLEAIELAKSSGKIKKGANEATKAVERGTAKLVAYAKDATPKELVMHIPLIAKEKKIPCFEVETKQELGAAAGLDVGTVAVAIVEEGEAKRIVESLRNQ